ncbi:probable carboxylesterase 18 [Phalaenopsis equestris]|uniref:probable carboxylesterase 18 n=1 Tax=Phalaenopsis equestris TaxID=78828 RepID=UPI0009E5C78C|nr:probable carboxylesterase 18 [Phalaenopsis equestris]XP_020598633.1 probable carboxylesterase 18 [Phalaenopsis equestris]
MSDGARSSAAVKSPKKQPLKVRLAVSFLSAVLDATRRSNGTINRRLLSFLDLRTSPNPVSHRGVRTVDLTVKPSHKLWIRLFIPDVVRRPQPLSLIVFFHGGGFAYLSPDNPAYDLACRRIAKAIPVVVASVNYRLAPEHTYPAPYEDGIDVLRFVDSGAIDAVGEDLVNPSSCFLAGDSAGANIAHHVARRWAAAGVGWKKLKVSGIVLIQPFFGGEERTGSEIRLARAPLVSTERTDWLWRAFLPAGADRDHEAANVFGPKATGELEEGFPPAMVVVGGHDPLQDWQRRYCEALRARGREVRLLEFPEAIHAFYVFPDIADGDRMIQEMGSFITSHG